MTRAFALSTTASIPNGSRRQVSSADDRYVSNLVCPTGRRSRSWERSAIAERASTRCLLHGRPCAEIQAGSVTSSSSGGVRSWISGESGRAPMEFRRASDSWAFATTCRTCSLRATRSSPRRATRRTGWACKKHSVPGSPRSSAPARESPSAIHQRSPELLLDDPSNAAALEASLRNWRHHQERLLDATRHLAAQLRQRTWTTMAQDVHSLLD